LAESHLWSGLILLSPFFGLPHGERILRYLSSILSLILPYQIWDNPAPAVYLTHDRDAIKRHEEDPLIQRRITLRFASEMLKQCENISNRAQEIKLPLMILASGEDRIVSVQKTISFYDAVGSKQKQIEIFEGFYHELLHETSRHLPVESLKKYLIQMGQ
jgi:alpha-beta hydrolase superfamily lysophospholipase